MEYFTSVQEMAYTKSKVMYQYACNALNFFQVRCKQVFERLMYECDERGHIKYAARLVERWNRKEEWCCAYSCSGEEAADITNNFCESAFRFVFIYITKEYVTESMQSYAGSNS